MGIGKSKITPSINIDDMLKKAESNHELEAEMQDVDKRLTEIREAKETLLKIHQDLQDAIKACLLYTSYYRQCEKPVNRMKLIVPCTFFI